MEIRVGGLLRRRAQIDNRFRLVTAKAADASSPDARFHAAGIGGEHTAVQFLGFLETVAGRRAVDLYPHSPGYDELGGERLRPRSGERFVQPARVEGQVAIVREEAPCRIQVRTGVGKQRIAGHVRGRCAIPQLDELMAGRVRVEQFEQPSREGPARLDGLLAEGTAVNRDRHEPISRRRRDGALRTDDRNVGVQHRAAEQQRVGFGRRTLADVPAKRLVEIRKVRAAPGADGLRGLIPPPVLMGPHGLHPRLERASLSCGSRSSAGSQQERGKHERERAHAPDCHIPGAGRQPRRDEGPRSIVMSA